MAVATLNGERLDGERRSWWMHSRWRVMRRANQRNDRRARHHPINDMVVQRLLNTSASRRRNAIYRLTPLAIGINDYLPAEFLRCAFYALSIV